MRRRVELKLIFSEERVARGIYDSLMPDNIDFPEGLEMNMSLSDRILMIDLASTDRFETLISTLEEIFSHIQLALDVLEESVNRYA